MKVFISQPMNGRNDEDIRAERVDVLKWLCGTFHTTFSEQQSFVEDLPSEITEGREPVYYLAKSIEKLVDADIVVMVGDWWHYRGCRIEHDIAIAYGIPCMTIETERRN